MKSIHFFLAFFSLANAACLSSVWADAANPRTAQQSGSAAFKPNPTSKTTKDGYTPMTAKKAGSGIEMSYLIEGTPAVGKPLTIRLKMTSPVNAQASVAAGEGLVVESSTPTMMVLEGQTTEHTVVVVPQAEGRFYLDVITKAGDRGSASAIAIQVGKAAVQAKRTGNVQISPGGERVISVPSQP